VYLSGKDNPHRGIRRETNKLAGNEERGIKVPEVT
jgi:hypothetical protein